MKTIIKLQKETQQEVKDVFKKSFNSKLNAEEYTLSKVTKLDETSSYGGIYNIIKKSKKDIKFISTGQNVPDDIKTPSKEELCSLILGDETIC